MKKLEQEQQEIKFLEYFVAPKKRVLLPELISNGDCIVMNDEFTTIQGLGNSAMKIFNGIPGIKTYKIVEDEFKEDSKSPNLQEEERTFRVVNRKILIELLEGLTSDSVTIRFFKSNNNEAPIAILGEIGDKSAAAAIACIVLREQEDIDELFAYEKEEEPKETFNLGWNVDFKVINEGKGCKIITSEEYENRINERIKSIKKKEEEDDEL